MGVCADNVKETHFAKRCRERGITETDTDVLFDNIRRAIEGGYDEYVKHVLTRDGGRFWRFKCAEGYFYAVTGKNDSFPRTVMTQEMFRHKRWAEKAKRGRKRPRKKR